jgi:hypothetical protein
MTAMYTVSIPEFQPGNRLYPILKICTASIIMHHIDFERDCLPQNRVSSMLRNAAARAKISDPRVPHNLGSQEVLNYWSKLIKADFQNQHQVSKIESVANETGNQQQLCNMLLDLTKEVRESRKEISEMRTSFNAVVLENASHKATISTMGSEMNDMKHRLQIAERKVTQLRTPPPPQKRSSPVMGSPHLHHASSPPFSPLIDVPVGVAPKLPKLALQYTFESAMVAEHEGKNKGERLAMILVDMARHKCIHPNQISKSSIPLAWNKNRSYLINCLELVEYAGDPNDIKMLATSQNEMDLQNVAYKFERVSLEKMLQLEDNSEKKGNKFKALIIGLGKRVRLYKQEIAEAKSLDSKKDPVPLMERSDLRKLQVEKRPGTPEGNMSILTAFGQKTKKQKTSESVE